MENCLVKKLKAVVDNPNLPILGEEILIHVVKDAVTITDGEKQQSFKVQGSRPFKVKVVGDGYISDNFATLETDRFTSVDIAADTLTTIYVADKTFDIAVTEADSLQTLDVRGNAKSSALGICYANLEECGTLSSLSGLNLSYTKTVGDLADISGRVNLVYLTLIGTLVEGTIESFVSGQVDAGVTSRTDGSFVASQLLNGRTTFGIMTAKQSLNPCVLQWNGKTKIFLFIGDNNINNCTVVYAKGATAEEISAWQAAGKTVTDVDTGTVYPPAN